MSMNAALNATVALIEGRTELARNILRGPGSDVRNVPEILARLERAVNKVAADTLRTALLRTLSAQPEESSGAAYEEGFYTGVAMVEAILEDIASNLERRSSD